MTGKNPGKHGIFSFFRLIPGTYKIGITSGKQRDGKTLWSILSDAGKKVGIINVPMTYPAESVNGFHLAGYPSPSYRDPYFSYPRGLGGEIQKVFGSYPAIPNTRGRLLKGDVDGAIEELCSAFDLKERHGNVILSIYKKIDKFLGDILEGLGEEWTLILVSDHGACMNHMGNSLLQSWLINLGVLHVKKRPLHHFVRLSRKMLRMLQPVARDFLPHWVRDKVKKLTPNLALSTNEYMLGGTSFNEIAWDKTKAFWLWEQLWINLEKRQPKGIVARGQGYEEVRDSLRTQLLQARDYKTGQRVIREVFKKEEVLKGKYLDEAPDLQIFWEEGSVISGMTARREEELEDRVAFSREDDIRTGEHSPYGMVILWGRGVKKGHLLSNAEIVDLPPTILHMMDQPIPSDMDGRVLVDAFEADFMKRPIRYEKAPHDGSDGCEETYDQEEMKQIREQLKGLGYLG